ncbi:MAG: hypothetical protein AMXMBFR64_27750 [Myxococcales bacterium]
MFRKWIPPSVRRCGLALCLWTVVSVVAACLDGVREPDLLGPQSVECDLVIPPEGGTLSCHPAVSLRVQPGSVAEAMPIRVGVTSPAALAPDASKHRLFRVSFTGLDQTTVEFERPVEITVDLAALRDFDVASRDMPPPPVSAGQPLAVLWVEGKEWALGQLDPSQGKVAWPVRHLSAYEGIVDQAAPGGLPSWPLPVTDGVTGNPVEYPIEAGTERATVADAAPGDDHIHPCQQVGPVAGAGLPAAPCRKAIAADVTRIVVLPHFAWTNDLFASLFGPMESVALTGEVGSLRLGLGSNWVDVPAPMVHIDDAFLDTLAAYVDDWDELPSLAPVQARILRLVDALRGADVRAPLPVLKYALGLAVEQGLVWAEIAAITSRAQTVGGSLAPLGGLERDVAALDGIREAGEAMLAEQETCVDDLASRLLASPVLDDLRGVRLPCGSRSLTAAAFGAELPGASSWTDDSADALTDMGTPGRKAVTAMRIAMARKLLDSAWIGEPVASAYKPECTTAQCLSELAGAMVRGGLEAFILHARARLLEEDGAASLAGRSYCMGERPYTVLSEDVASCGGYALDAPGLGALGLRVALEQSVGVLQDLRSSWLKPILNVHGVPDDGVKVVSPLDGLPFAPCSKATGPHEPATGACGDAFETVWGHDGEKCSAWYTVRVSGGSSVLKAPLDMHVSGLVEPGTGDPTLGGVVCFQSDLKDRPSDAPWMFCIGGLGAILAGGQGSHVEAGQPIGIVSGLGAPDGVPLARIQAVRPPVRADGTITHGLPLSLAASMPAAECWAALDAFGSDPLALLGKVEAAQAAGAPVVE